MAIISAQSGLNQIFLSTQRIFGGVLALGWGGLFGISDSAFPFLVTALLIVMFAHFLLLSVPLLRMLVSLASVASLTSFTMLGAHFIVYYELENTALPDTFPLESSQWISYAAILAISLLAENVLGKALEHYEQQTAATSQQ